MPHLTTDDGISLYYEETGSGTPIVLVHEFADDYRGYEGQMRYFGRRYRCIAYNARGFPPSDVPDTVERYSQARARDTIAAAKAKIGYARLDTATDVAKVSVIGSGMRSHAGVAAKAFAALAARNINIRAITTSEIKFSVLIDTAYTELAVRTLHTLYGLDQV